MVKREYATFCKKNLVLIGMPGAGKSTVGSALAQKLAWDFRDTDDMLEKRHSMPLQTLLERHGYLKLRKLEGEVVLGEDFKQTVIATGGSMVYSKVGMNALKEQAGCIYLQAEKETLLNRIGNTQNRGFSAAPGQSFEQVYLERYPLYEKYADIVVKSDGKSLETVVSEIIDTCKLR